MTQMVNSWKDQIPVLVCGAAVEEDARGRDLVQESDHCEVMTQPITKWYWAAKTTGSIPETVRRGMKFASTSPCGPVFLSLPTNTLREEATAAIWDQAKFDVPMRIRPDKDDIRSEEHTSELQSHLNPVSRLLLEKKKQISRLFPEATLKELHTFHPVHLKGSQFLYRDQRSARPHPGKQSPVRVERPHDHSRDTR